MAIGGAKFILIFCMILISVSTIKAVDIRSILDNHNEFSLFRDLLTHTNLEKEINNRQTLTILVLDNSVMGSIMSKPWDESRNMLATHVILEYFDETRLLHDLHDRSVILTTLFQSTGLAVNKQGLLNVTVSDSGGIVFGSAVPGAPHASKMVKSVVAIPYEVSVIQISQPIMTPGLSQISPLPSSSPSQSASPSPSSSRSPGSNPSSSLSPTPTPSPSSSPSPPSVVPTPTPSEHAASPAMNSIDITKILDNYAQFTSFRDAVRRSNLENDINQRYTLTVLVLDNSMMDTINRMPLDQSKRVLATHLILDYLDEKKLADMHGQTATLTTLFQTTGMAIDRQGLLNLTVSDSGDVVFGSAVQGAPHASKMVRSVVSHPYQISVIQISQPIMTPGLVAPISNPSPSPNPSSPVPASSPNGHTTSPTPAPLGPTPHNTGSPVPVPASHDGPSITPAPAPHHEGPLPPLVPHHGLTPVPAPHEGPLPALAPHHDLTSVPAPHEGPLPALAPHHGLTPAPTPSPRHRKGVDDESEGPESEEQDYENALTPELSPHKAPTSAADEKEEADKSTPPKLKSGAAHLSVGGRAVVAALVALATSTLA